MIARVNKWCDIIVEGVAQRIARFVVRNWALPVDLHCDIHDQSDPSMPTELWKTIKLCSEAVCYHRLASDRCPTRNG